MRIQRFSFAVVVLLSGAVGCQKSSPDADVPAASASATSALASPSATASARPMRPRGSSLRHAGVAASLFAGARDLPDLTDPQQTALAKVDADLKADDESVRSSMRSFRSDLVTGVRAGKLDTTKLTADEGAIDKAIAQHQTAEAQAIEGLHGLLTPVQRTALTSNIRTRQTERENRMMSWMNAKEADGGAADWSKRRLDKLTADLTLDDGQQKQVAALLAKSAEVPSGATMQTRWDDRRTRTEALLTAFAGDTIDAKSLDLAILPAKTPHEPMEHVVAFFSKLTGILRPDQRDKLAQSIDHSFGAMGRPAPGARGPNRGIADDIVFPFVEPVDHAPDEPPSVQ